MKLRKVPEFRVELSQPCDGDDGDYDDNIMMMMMMMMIIIIIIIIIKQG
jgi:hypothetical protein